MKKVIIFRNQLFKFSETFITHQASRLTNYTPIYLGRERQVNTSTVGKSLALDDIERQKKFPYKHWQVITRSPKYYIELVKSMKPDLIHAHFAVDSVCALPLAKELGIPLITTFHGFDATISRKALILSGSPSWINYALMRKKLSHQGDLFICVSDFIYKRVIGMGFPKERTVRHYIGVDIENIKPEFKVSSNFQIVHVARLVETKGTEYLLKALAKARQRLKNIKLKIIGDGPLKEFLVSMSNRLGISESVDFLGIQPHNEVIKFMRASDLVILPSIRSRNGAEEGLGMILLEACAAGKPIIGTNTGGIPEVIKDGYNGFIVSERNEVELAEKIVDIFSDNDLGKRMGFAARKHVEKHFNIDNQTKELEKIYDMVTPLS